ncbi:MAG: type 4b pilus protein PilO2 [Alphaproteobacteria bacterium]|nr:type 4b pilus protein PilO2 [Alphaproteobacteria bacterium]
MSAQVITINRKKYAVGLFWQPMAMVGNQRAFARSLAYKINKNLNLFTEYHSMLGLGARRMGHRVGMPSAAAEIVNTLTEYNSFLGVFDTGHGFYLLAVRNGVILTDTIFAHAEDARAEYFKLSEIPDWGALFAPAGWGMPRATEHNLYDLIHNNVHGKLRPISRGRAFLWSFVLMIGFCVSFWMIFYEPIIQMIMPRPQISQIDPELAAEYHRQIDEKNKQLDEQFEIVKEVVPEPDPIVLPYDKLPDVALRADMCYRAIGLLMQSIYGWRQVSVECDTTHAIAAFSRQFGTLTSFYDIATELIPGAFVVEQSPNSVNVRVALPQVATNSSVEERDADSVARAVRTAFQSAAMPVDVDVTSDVLTNGVETVVLNVVEIAVESKLAPMQFMKIFDDFSGVYMTRSVWDVTDRTWNYEVIIYAK